MTEDVAREQLQMLWPESRLRSPPALRLADGYELRTCWRGAEPGFLRVMALAGFEGWDDQALRPWLAMILPDGWFFIVHRASEAVVATAMALHNPSDLHPFGGELGWVAADPAHAGNGLGAAVCAAATVRFVNAGYRRIYLKTDDWRLPALKTYLKLGYVPFLLAPQWEY